MDARIACHDLFRSRATSAAVTVLLALAGCSGDDGSSGSSGTETSSGTSTSTGSSSGPTGSGTSVGTASATGTSGTSSSGGDTGTATSTGTAGSGTGTTGGGLEPECAVDADCTVHEDCCTCEAVPADITPADCESECTVTACKAIDYGATPVCKDGICRFPETTCDPSGVLCGAPTPSCPTGTLPEVQGACWTFKCVPIAACDWVPDCSYCNPATEVCVVEQTEQGPRHDCEPIPWQCGDGPVNCDCAGQLCEAPFDQCSVGQTPGSLTCDCPACG